MIWMSEHHPSCYCYASEGCDNIRGSQQLLATSGAHNSQWQTTLKAISHGTQIGTICSVNSIVEAFDVFWSAVKAMKSRNPNLSIWIRNTLNPEELSEQLLVEEDCICACSRRQTTYHKDGLVKI